MTEMLTKEVTVNRKHVMELQLELLRTAPCRNVTICGFLWILL